MIERSGVFAFKGAPVTLIGPAIEVGQQAPDFTVVANDLSNFEFMKETAGTVRIVNAVPSLDTGVCDTETRRFNQEAANLPGVKVLTISMDLPFAQKRWCGAAGIENVKTLSDFRDAAFGKAFGVLQKEWRLLARASFVVDKNDKVVYAEYCPNAPTEPSYEKVVAAARAAAQG